MSSAMVAPSSNGLGQRALFFRVKAHPPALEQPQYLQLVIKILSCFGKAPNYFSVNATLLPLGGSIAHLMTTAGVMAHRIVSEKGSS